MEGNAENSHGSGESLPEGHGGRTTIHRKVIEYLVHEIRTPLTAISSSAELIESKGVSEEEGEMLLGIIRKETERLNSLLDDFSTHCERDSDPWLSRPICAAVDVCDLLNEAANRFRSKAPTHPIRIEISEKVLQIQGDRKKLCIALRNLLGNAVKYSPTGGNITLSARSEGPMIIITVCDEGIGIAKENLQRIFHPSFRSSREDSRGTGLGLSIVSSIVYGHRGRIEVESEPGEGTSFHLFLPRFT